MLSRSSNVVYHTTFKRFHVEFHIASLLKWTRDSKALDSIPSSGWERKISNRKKHHNSQCGTLVWRFRPIQHLHSLYWWASLLSYLFVLMNKEFKKLEDSCNVLDNMSAYMLERSQVEETTKRSNAKDRRGTDRLQWSGWNSKARNLVWHH